MTSEEARKKLAMLQTLDTLESMSEEEEREGIRATIREMEEAGWFDWKPGKRGEKT